jgi:hypothetical protein
VVERTHASLTGINTHTAPGLVLALHGWFGFIDEVSIAWLEQPTISRVELREMLVGQFVAILRASRRPALV